MSKQVHVNIFGVIEYEPSNMWADAFGSCRLIDVKNTVEAASDAEEIVVHINSPGGDVIEGFAIQEYLAAQKANGKKITTAIEGRCYSMATIILLEGDERYMASGSEFMIHNPWGIIGGTADELQQFADEIREKENQMALFYAEKTGADEQQIRDLMNNETFMAAETALEMKFITKVGMVIKAKAKAFALFRTPPKSNASKHKIDMSKENLSKAKKMFGDLAEAFGMDELAKSIRGDASGAGTTKDFPITSGDDAGKTLTITMSGTEPAIGDSATIDGQPATGSWEIEEKNMITCENGNITDIQPVDDNSAEPEALKTELAAVKAELTALKNLKKDAAKLVATQKENLSLKAQLAAAKKNAEDNEKELEKLVSSYAPILARVKELKASGSNFNPPGDHRTDAPEKGADMKALKDARAKAREGKKKSVTNI